MAKPKENRISTAKVALGPGLYESILTVRLNELLAAKRPGRAFLTDLDFAEAPALLAGHLAEIIERTLGPRPD